MSKFHDSQSDIQRSQLRNRKRNKQKSNKKRNKQKVSSSDYKPLSPKSKSTWSAWPMSFTVLIILSLIVFNGLQYNIPSINGNISDKKPYKTVDEFYPYYLSQHSHPDCQRTHIFASTVIVLIVLVKPEIAITSFIALLSTYVTFPAFRGMDNGLCEGLVLIAVGAFMGHLHGIKKYMLMAVVVGYGFAWFGHFYFEKNTPATFIYPSYSLVSDFRMFGAFYKQLLSTNNWEVLWDRGIDFNEALGRTV